jgi:hypothetical protein
MKKKKNMSTDPRIAHTSELFCLACFSFLAGLKLGETEHMSWLSWLVVAVLLGGAVATAIEASRVVWKPN